MGGKTRSFHFCVQHEAHAVRIRAADTYSDRSRSNPGCHGVNERKVGARLFGKLII